MTSERSSGKLNNVCFQRGGNEFDINNDWNFQDSGFGRTSGTNKVQMPQIQYLMDRESAFKQFDEESIEKKSAMSLEDAQQLQKQSIQSFQSRGSNFNLFNRFSGYQFEQPKNSLTYSQTNEQNQLKFSIDRSEKASIEDKSQHSFRQSNLSNNNRKSKENELEIVFEWQDESNNQNAIEDLINKLTLEKQQDIIPDRLSLIPQQKQGCICKKTQCLKFYCQCFQQGKYCNEFCECLECCNNEEHKELIEQTKTQIVRNNNEEIKCFCKKSKCLKKYCECFQAGKKCGIECKCEGCQNNEQIKEELIHQGQRLSEFQQQQKRVQISRVEF